MNKSTPKILAIAVVLLVAILFAVDLSGNRNSGSGGDVLYPELKSRINDVREIGVTRAGEGNSLTIAREENGWVVRERDGYAADVGKIRDVLLQVADARIIERKTSNPERYHALGVQAPGEEDSAGVALSIAGDGFGYTLIVGKTAQTDYRYVRRADAAQGLLIDRDPEIPDANGDWLRPEIVDIDAAEIKAVTITHADGESIRVAKESEDDSAYVVADIPPGRELSYPNVAGGMGGVLAALTLEDVRKSEPLEQVVTTVFETFDGLQVTVRSQQTDADAWIELSADMGDDERAATINDRVSGWQYKVASYKANLLMRRWEDILKAPDPVE